MVKNHIAILTDAENISYRYIESLMKQTKDYMNKQPKDINTLLTHNLAFANWASLNNKHWIEKTQIHGIKQKQAASYSKGKNSSDMSLTIYAIDAAFTKNIDTFIIVTGDSDFTELVLKLKEYGKKVIVCGEKNGNKSITFAGNEFWELEKEESEIEKEERVKLESLADNIEDLIKIETESKKQTLTDIAIEKKEEILNNKNELLKNAEKAIIRNRQSNKKSTKNFRNPSQQESKIYALQAFKNLSTKQKSNKLDISALYQEMKRLSKEDTISINYKKLGFGRLKYYIKKIDIFILKEEINKNEKIITIQLKK